MAELGTYYITIMPSMNKFTGEVKSALGEVGATAGKTVSNSMWDVLKGSALGTMVGNMASMIGGEIANGIGVGISRLDTLKNYPRVMEALGYSTLDADRSVRMIMEHLDGLPTTTQDMVTLTQAIADSTGDLDLATRAALGFNDMMLANGASAGEMTQAMGVFNRVLGKGNATTAQWMSLQSVMPAQLALVARELMGEGASVESLRDALNNGDIAWNDFLRAIVRLDEEGTGAVASFTDQARANVDGIGTALTNLPNRIGQGWADIFDAIGRENISGTINAISYGIRDAMRTVGEAVEWLKWMILGSSIDESLVRIFNNLKEAFAGFFEGASVANLKELARTFIDWAEGGLKWIADNGDLVTTALWGIAGVLSALAGWKLGTELLTFFSMLETFGAAVAATNPFLLIAGGIVAAGTALYGFLTKTETGQKVFAKLKDAIKDLWAKGKEAFRKLTTEAKKFVDAANKKWEELVAKAKTIWKTIQTVVTTIVTALTNAVTAKWEEIRTTHERALNIIKTVFTTIFNALSTTAITIFNTIKTTIQTAMNAVNTVITTILNAIKAVWDATLGKLLSGSKTTFNGIKSVVDTMGNGLKSVFNGLTTALPNAARTIYDKATSTFNSMRDKVASAFSSMRSSAVGQMNSLDSEAASKASKIANHFNRQRPKISIGVSYPYLSSVHASVKKSMKQALLTGGGVIADLYWAAKGGVFDQAAIIGIGEAGKEVAMPLNSSTYSEMARGIVAQMEGKGQAGVLVTGNNFYVRNDQDIDRIADAIALRATRTGKGLL